ncbi:MAG: precorrin-6y C5,15-methyltransferase (decarboxylating) subunit CbiE [Planctomycetota bacterium]
MSKIAIVGCGPGAASYLTPLARQTVEQAEALVGARRWLDLFPESKAERIAVTADIQKALNEIAARQARQRIAVLVSGDPGLCSFAQPVIKRFGLAACEIIPGISSVQVAFARLGLDWLDARFLSAHHHDPDMNFATVATASKIAILAGYEGAMSWIARFASTLSPDYRIFICENLTLNSERIYEVARPDLAALRNVSCAIVLLIRKDALP